MSARRDRAPIIIAGRFRGRRLRVPEGRITRPARARVRRSLLDILQPRLPGSRWLDLYAGSGSLGLEALSRGAECAWLVEAGSEGLQCLEHNLRALQLGAPEVRVISRSVPELFLDPELRPAVPFTLISMDPPFAVSRSARLLQELCEGLARAAVLGWFEPGALLAWEEPAEAPAPLPGGFREVDVRRYGTSRVRFLEVEAAPAGGPAETSSVRGCF